MGKDLYSDPYWGLGCGPSGGSLGAWEGLETWGCLSGVWGAVGLGAGDLGALAAVMQPVWGLETYGCLFGRCWGLGCSPSGGTLVLGCSPSGRQLWIYFFGAKLPHESPGDVGRRVPAQELRSVAVPAAS